MNTPETATNNPETVENTETKDENTETEAERTRLVIENLESDETAIEEDERQDRSEWQEGFLKKMNEAIKKKARFSTRVSTASAVENENKYLIGCY